MTEKKICELYAFQAPSGYGSKAIDEAAKVNKCSRADIVKILHSNGLALKYSETDGEQVQLCGKYFADKKRIIELYNAGMSYDKISKELDIRVEFVENLCRKMIEEGIIKSRRKENEEMNYTTKTKSAAINEYLEGGKKALEVAEKYGVNVNTLKSWVKNARKASGLSKKEHKPLINKEFDETVNQMVAESKEKEPETKAQELSAPLPDPMDAVEKDDCDIIELYNSGLSYTEIANKLNIMPETVMFRCKQLLKNGALNKDNYCNNQEGLSLSEPLPEPTDAVETDTEFKEAMLDSIKNEPAPSANDTSSEPIKNDATNNISQTAEKCKQLYEDKSRHCFYKPAEDCPAPIAEAAKPTVPPTATTLFPYLMEFASTTLTEPFPDVEIVGVYSNDKKKIAELELSAGGSNYILTLRAKD